MGKSVAVLALLAGVGLAVAMHGTHRADPPQPGPDLPALAEMAVQPGPDLDAAWPARAELAALASNCAGCLPADTSATPGLRIGLDAPGALDRLQAAPPAPAANPLLVPGDASLNDLPRLELAPAPEPQSWAMFLAGMALVGRQLRRRRPAYLATL